MTCGKGPCTSARTERAHTSTHRYRVVQPVARVLSACGCVGWCRACACRGQLRQCRAEGEGQLAPDEADDNVLQVGVLHGRVCGECALNIDPLALVQFYEGGWHNGLKNGLGTAHYRNGDVYQGTWRDNKMSGTGVYRWSDGTVFAGQFQDDEMHGDGECCWSDGLRVQLAFTHCYPNHVRSAVRVLCGLLLVCTLVYVMPHLVDMTSAEPPAPDSLAASVDSGVATERALAEDSAQGHCDYIVREAPPWSSQVFELFSWPWSWLWPWSEQQLEARAQAKHEAVILAMGGLKGVHIKGLWGAADDEALSNAPVGCLDGVAVATGALDGSDRELQEAWDDETDFDGVADVDFDVDFEGHGGVDELEDDDYDMGTAAVAGPFDPATFLDDGSDYVVLRSAALKAKPNGSRGDSDDASRDASPTLDEGCFEGDCDGATAEAGGDGEASSADDGTGSTILTVLTLYLRLHLKRQLHYLRLGMLALFTLTGRCGLVWLPCPSRVLDG